MPTNIKFGNYQPQAFDEEAYKADLLNYLHGSKASKKDIRKFNKQMSSAAGLATIAKARQDHDLADQQRYAEAYMPKEVPVAPVSPVSTAKLGDAYTNLPGLYQTKAFDEQAFKDSYLAEQHGTLASRKDIRKTNEYFNSEEGKKAITAAKQAHDANERKQWSDSYSTRMKAMDAEHDRRVAAAKSEWDAAIAKYDATPKETPEVKLKPRWTATNASVDNGATTYKVQAGNTLGQIVADYNKKNPGANLKWQDVAKWSGIADPSKMRIGQVINFADPSIDPVKEEDVKDESVKDVDVKVEDPADSLSVKDPADSLRNSLDSLKMGIVRDSIAVADSISNPALNKTLLANRRNMYDVMRANGFGTPTLTVPKVNIPQVPSNKQGGNMNRINYFQQGGSAQPNSSDAFMQAILQGDPQAVQQLVQEAANGNKQAEDLIKAILEGAQQGNQQVMKAAQAIAAVVQQAQGQATAAKWGAKLGYIRSLKYAKGGKACPACEKAAKVEMKKCGGKKSKRK